jgi:hypothetical protein
LGGFIGSTNNGNLYAKTAGDDGRKPTPKKTQTRKEGRKVSRESLEENQKKKIQFQTVSFASVLFQQWQKQRDPGFRSDPAGGAAL